MAEGDEDRTEAPTQRRLQRAREAGQTALSRDLVTLVGLGAATLLLSGAGGTLGRALLRRLAPLLASPQDIAPKQAARLALEAFAIAAFPVALTAISAAALATLLQTGFVMNPGALQPDLSRLDPRRRIASLFGIQALPELAKSLAKLATVSFAAWLAFRAAAPHLPEALDRDSRLLGGAVAAGMLRILAAVLTAQFAIALLDVALVRFRHWRGLRMSRHEIKEEHREQEGDPAIRRRIRRLQQQRARQRMMAAVPKATVVLTNPTHYAVALAYDRNRGGAPRVTAKGTDEVAARIREAARAHNIPLVANPPLARALHAVPLDAEIPAEHYRVVAEIIAYVWRLQGRLPKASASVSGTA